jgi:hypothetical protein
MDSPKTQNYKDKMEEVLQRQEKTTTPSYADMNTVQQLDEQTRKALRYKDATTTRPLYADAVRTTTRIAIAKKNPDNQSRIALGTSNERLFVATPVENQPKIFEGTTNGRIFARQVEAYCRTIEGVSPYQKILIQLSYMKGPKVKDWVNKMYKEASIRVSHDINARDDPALWIWFQQTFDLGYEDTKERYEAMKALLKLRVTKGDIETYIK